MGDVYTHLGDTEKLLNREHASNRDGVRSSGYVKVLFGNRVSEWAQRTVRGGLWQIGEISAEEVDMPNDERRNPGDVGPIDTPSFPGEMVGCGLNVCRVPQRDCVQRRTGGAELLLLLSVDLPNLATIAVADAACRAVPELLAVGRLRTRQHFSLTIDVAAHLKRLNDAAEFGDRADQRGRTILQLKDTLWHRHEYGQA